MTELPQDPTVGTSLTPADKAPQISWSASKYSDKFPEALLAHLSEGFSFYSFNVKGGVTTGTLINWCKKYPGFAQAREIGEKARLMLLEDEGMKMVKGGNVIAWKFMMNQLGITEKVDHNIQHNVSHSPHMGVDTSVRYVRLQKLKELHQRVTFEKTQPKEVPAYDALFDT